MTGIVPDLSTDHAGPVAFAEVGLPPAESEYGPVQADVSYVKVKLDNGTVLTLHPVTVYDARVVGFATPARAVIVSATAYSRHGEIANAIPFNEPDGQAFLRYLAQARPARHRPRLGPDRLRYGRRQHLVGNCLPGPMGRLHHERNRAHLRGHHRFQPGYGGHGVDEHRHPAGGHRGRLAVGGPHRRARRRRDGRRAIVTGHGGRARSRTAGPPKSSCGGCRTRPRWAPRISGELRERLYKRFPHVRELTPAVERTGVMPPVHPGGGVDRGAATAGPGSFCGFCHRPQQLRGELRDAGLTVAELVSVEGPAFLLGDLAEQLEDPVARVVVLDTARALESVPELLGIGPHLLATGIRP